MIQRSPDWIANKREEIGPILNGLTRLEIVVVLLSTIDALAVESGNRDVFWCRIVDMIVEAVTGDRPGPNDTIQ